MEFTSLASATKAFETAQDEPLFVVGRTVRVDYAPARQRVVSEPYHKLYVYDFTSDEHALRAAFKDYDSNILSVHMSTYLNIFSLS